MNLIWTEVETKEKLKNRHLDTSTNYINNKRRESEKKYLINNYHCYSRSRHWKIIKKNEKKNVSILSFLNNDALKKLHSSYLIMQHKNLNKKENMIKKCLKKVVFRCCISETILSMIKTIRELMKHTQTS